MSKLWQKIAIFVLVIAVSISLYRVAYHTPAVEPGTAEQVDDNNLNLQQRLTKQLEARTKRSEELREKGVDDFSATIEDRKHLGAERLYNRALFESRIAMDRTGDYKKMVDYCRRLLSEYPDSPQAVEAKKLLGLMPAEDKEKYNITEEEMGL